MKFEYKNYKGKRRIRQVDPKQLVHGVTPHITSPTWLLEAFDPEDQINKLFVLENIQRFCPTHEIQRIPCVTTYLVNENHEFFLMYHKKLNAWVPPGGKIERDELPHEGALRETFEETKLCIDLIDPPLTPSNVPAPHGVQENVICEGAVHHVDYVYLGQTTAANFDLDPSEAEQARWVGLEDLEALNTYDEVKDWIAYFAHYLEQRSM